MNIVHIATQGTWGGGEKQVWYLLNELRTKGIAQTLVCSKQSPLAKKCKESGYRVIEIPKSMMMTMTWAIHLRKLLQNIQTPILHAHDGKAHNIALMYTLLQKSPAPLVISRRLVQLKSSRYQRWKFNHRNVRKIICISSAVRESVATLMDDTSRLVVIPSGIDVQSFSKKNTSKSEIKTSLGLPADSRLILNIGSLVAQKQQKTFLQAAKFYLELNPQHGKTVFFAILGEGPLHQELDTYIRDNGLSTNALLLGFSDTAQAILAASDVLVSTSIEEALGNVIMEAFVANVPVIASDSGGVRDLIDDNKTGLLVPIQNPEAVARACEKLLSKPQLYQDLQRNAQNKIQLFRTDKMADDILKVYKSL